MSSCCFCLSPLSNDFVIATSLAYYRKKVKGTLYFQKYLLVCLYMIMNLIDIPFLIHRVLYDVGPPFTNSFDS